MFYSGERTKKEICANQPPSPLPFQKFSTFLFSSAGVTKRQEEEWREIDFAWGGKRGKSNSSSSLVSAVTAEEGLKVAEEGNKPIMYRTEGREREVTFPGEQRIYPLQGRGNSRQFSQESTGEKKNGFPHSILFSSAILLSTDGEFFRS